MPLQLVSPPAAEPVSLAEAKLHLKIDTDADDVLIARMISAARARAEWHTGRALITQSWILWCDAWPESGMVEIPLPPLQNVASVTAYALDDTAHVLDSDIYAIDTASAPGRLKFADCMPPFPLRRMNALAIAFTAGYGDAADDVPELLREAVLSLVAYLYEHRGEAPAELPLEAHALLAPYRIVHL